MVKARRCLVMRAQSRPAASSTSRPSTALFGIPFQSAYTASKHAIEGYSECLADGSQAPFGVRGVPGGAGRPQRRLPEDPAARGGLAARRRPTGMQACRKVISVIARDEAAGSDPEKLRFGSRRRRTFLPKSGGCRFANGWPNSTSTWRSSLHSAVSRQGSYSRSCTANTILEKEIRLMQKKQSNTGAL